MVVSMTVEKNDDVLKVFVGFPYLGADSERFLKTLSAEINVN